MDQSVPLVQFVNRPGIIDLAWGHPNPDLLPVEGLRNTSGHVFERYGADALNYGSAAGPGPLIDWLGSRLSGVDGYFGGAGEIRTREPGTPVTAFPVRTPEMGSLCGLSASQPQFDLNSTATPLQLSVNGTLFLEMP